VRTAPTLVRRELFKFNVLKNALQETYSKGNSSTRRALSLVLKQKIVEKYKQKKNMSVIFGLADRKRHAVEMNRTRRLHAENIEKFFLREDVSFSTAGKKETITRKKQKKQKRFLTKTMKELHTIYNSENEKKVSYATFIRCRPFYVKASALYHKTKLCVHNFTICNVETMDAMCYWFDEIEGDLQASTFASCLVHYLKTYVLPVQPSNPIKIYSDGCIYQNRNSTMANALLHLSLDYDIEIIQLFLIKGHTQMVVDSVHATIVKSLKNRDVYLPSDYVKISTEARKKPTTYRAMLLDHSFFKDYNQDVIYDSIRPGRVKGDPVVVDIRRIMYKKGDIEGMVEGVWMPLPRRPKSSPVKNHIFPALHKQRIKIRKSKFKHLQ